MNYDYLIILSILNQKLINEEPTYGELLRPNE